MMCIPCSACSFRSLACFADWGLVDGTFFVPVPDGLVDLQDCAAAYVPLGYACPFSFLLGRDISCFGFFEDWGERWVEGRCCLLISNAL